MDEKKLKNGIANAILVAILALSLAPPLCKFNKLQSDVLAQDDALLIMS